MPLHFVVDDASTARPGDAVTLTGPEAHHAAGVRRVRIGEEVTLGDGRGVWLTGECASVAPREVVITVTGRLERPAASPRLVLVQALAKGDRDELAIQAATELGIDEVVPWQATRSVSRWDAGKAEKGRARWTAITREAAKQSHRAWIPQIAPLSSTAALAQRAAASRLLILEPTAEQAITSLSFDHADTRDVVLVVGPEGGVSPQELAELAAAGATPVRLGDTVLRTSTAGPAAIAVVSALLGRW